MLKGKGPGNIEWVIGYDAKADKWLDVNVKYKFGGNANHFIQVGQYKQPNSLEELSSTKNNDFISKAAVTNTFGVARRLGAHYSYGDDNWGLTASMFTRELTEHPAPTPHGPGYGLRGYWAPINDQRQHPALRLVVRELRHLPGHHRAGARARMPTWPASASSTPAT